MITYSEYLAYVEEARKCKSARDFLSEYGFPADCPYTPEGLITFCEIIFAVAQAQYDFNGFAKLCGRGFSTKHHINAHTYNNWVSGRAKAPMYVVELLGYSMLADLPKESEKES